MLSVGSFSIEEGQRWGSKGRLSLGCSKFGVDTGKHKTVFVPFVGRIGSPEGTKCCSHERKPVEQSNTGDRQPRRHLRFFQVGCEVVFGESKNFAKSGFFASNLFR